MASISGSFTVPGNQQIAGGGGQQREPGEIVVFDWTKCRILIDKTVYGELISMNCVRSADLSAGIATIKMSDPKKSTYSAIQTGMEVEIYLSEQSPMTYANKVWGGFLESREFNVDKKIILVVKAKEYSQNLILNVTDQTAVSNHNSFSAVEPGTAIKDLMAAYQVDFTTDNVITGTTSVLSAGYLGKTLFDVLNSICTQFNYVWYIDINKDLHVQPITQVNPAPATDYLTYGDNLYGIQEQENKELMVNDLYVQGNTPGTVSSHYTNAASIAAYGLHAKRLVAASLTTVADCNNYAAACVDLYGNPIQQYVTSSRLVAFSDPLEYITVKSTPNNLDGTYQIREIDQTYDKTGIRTSMTLGMKITSLSMALGNILSRVSAIEQTTYV